MEYPVQAVKDLTSPALTAARKREELAAAGYRYVVWHKTPEAPPGQEQLVKSIFVAPVFEDDLVTVYEAQPANAPSLLEPASGNRQSTSGKLTTIR